MLVDLQDIMHQTKAHFEKLAAADEPWPDQLVAVWDGAPVMYVYLATDSQEQMYDAILTTCVGTACDTAMLVVDTYRTTLDQKLDGSEWTQGDMERIFLTDGPEKPFIFEALALTVVDRLQNLSAMHWQYKRDGKKIIWSDLEIVDPGLDSGSGQKGFFSDAMRAAMGMPTLLDRFRGTFPDHAALMLKDRKLHQYMLAQVYVETARRLLDDINLPVAIGAIDEDQMKVYTDAFPEGMNINVTDEGIEVMESKVIRLNEKEDKDG